MFQRTVRCKIPEGTEFDFTNFFKSLNESFPKLKGIQALGKGSVVDLCFENQAAADLAAAQGINYHEIHLDLKPLAQQQLQFVSVFLPIEFEDSELRQLLRLYGEVKHIRRLYHKAEGLQHLENGCRVVTFQKLNKPLPMRLSYKGISIGFKYTGQPKSCLRCSSLEHIVADCPYKKTKPPKPTNTSTTSNEETEPLDNNTQEQNPPPPASGDINANQQETMDHQTTSLKRRLDSPNKDPTTKHMTLDHFEDFEADLRGKHDSPRLLSIAKDKVTKARALYLQKLKGNFSEQTKQQLQKIKYPDKDTILKSWQKLAGTLQPDAQAELILLYNSNFKHAYNRT